MKLAPGTSGWLFLCMISKQTVSRNSRQPFTRQETAGVPSNRREVPEVDNSRIPNLSAWILGGHSFVLGTRYSVQSSSTDTNSKHAQAPQLNRPVCERTSRRRCLGWFHRSAFPCHQYAIQ